MTDYLEKSIKQSIWTFFYKIFQMSSGLITSVLLTRYLTLREYGCYRFIYSISAVLNYLTSCGIESTLLRYIPEYIEQKNYRKINGLLICAVSLRILTLSIFLGSTWIWRDLFFNTFHFPDFLIHWYFFVCLFIFLSQAHAIFGLTLISAFLEQKLLSIIESIAIMIRLLSIGIVIYFDLKIYGVIIYLITVEGLLFLSYAAYAIKKGLKNDKQDISSQCALQLDFKRIFRFASYSYFLSATSLIREFAIDNFIIAHYLDMKQVAIYSLATGIMEFTSNFNPSMFLKNIVNYVFVRKFTANNKLEKLAYGNELLIKISAFIIIPAFMTLAILLKPIILYIYKEAYISAIPIIYCLMVFFLINNTLLYGINQVFLTLELTNLCVYGSILTGLYNLIMEIILVPRIGIMGAALATGSSAILMITYYFAIIYRIKKMKLNFPFKTLLKIILCTLLVSLVIMKLKTYAIGIISLVIISCIGAVIYLALCYYIKPFEDKDRQFINSILKKKHGHSNLSIKQL